MEQYTLDDVKVRPQQLKAVVVKIEELTAGAVYGTETKDQSQPVAKVYYENKEENVQGDEVITLYPKGQVPDASKLGKYLQKYKGLAVGQVVDLQKNKNGFYELQL